MQVRRLTIPVLDPAETLAFLVEEVGLSCPIMLTFDL